MNMLMAQEIQSSPKPSLLTKTEMDCLSGKAHLSKTYEYKIKSIIKRKLKAFNEFELPLILKSGLFPEAEKLVIFKNHNESMDNPSWDYSNSSIKEEEETWAGFGQGSLINESNLGKAKVPGPNPGQGLLVLLPSFRLAAASLSVYLFYCELFKVPITFVGRLREIAHLKYTMGIKQVATAALLLKI